MKIVFDLLSWLFGFLFFISSITIIFESSLAGLTFIAISLLLFPPFRVVIHYFTRIKLETSARGVSILLLLISFGFVMANDSKIKSQTLINTVETSEILELNETKTLAVN